MFKIRVTGRFELNHKMNILNQTEAVEEYVVKKKEDVDSFIDRFKEGTNLRLSLTGLEYDFNEIDKYHYELLTDNELYSTTTIEVTEISED